MKNNVQKISLMDCVGCSVCETICPKKAIKLQENKFGFFSPLVNNEKCINCELCLSKCVINNLPDERMPIIQFAGWNNNDIEKYNSTSGGIFIGVANQILKEEGVVFAATYSDDCKRVYHTSTDDVELTKLQKSKYVVSDLGDCFSKILEMAKSGRVVLFVGTPCQCAGLASLVKNFPNVLTMDFICGGVPSHKAYVDYLKYKEKKKGLRIVDIDFRKKDTGWKKQYLYIQYENGEKEQTFYLYDPYFSMFVIEHLSTRFSCDQCKFRKRHMSDITIADYWGFRDIKIKDDDTGISLISINSSKGKLWFDKFEDKSVLILDKKDIAYAYENFVENEERSRMKNRFMQELICNDFNNICNNYVKTDKISVFLKRVKSKLGI